MSMTKDQIMAASQLLMAPVQFKVPELGEVSLRRLTIRQKEDWRASLRDGKGDLDPAKLAAGGINLVRISLIDDSGEPMFTNDELSQLPSSLIERIGDEIRRINRMTPEAIAEAEKN